MARMTTESGREAAAPPAHSVESQTGRHRHDAATTTRWERIFQTERVSAYRAPPTIFRVRCCVVLAMRRRLEGKYCRQDAQPPGPARRSALDGSAESGLYPWLTRRVLLGAFSAFRAAARPARRTQPPAARSLSLPVGVARGALCEFAFSHAAPVPSSPCGFLEYVPLASRVADRPRSRACLVPFHRATHARYGRTGRAAGPAEFANAPAGKPSAQRQRTWQGAARVERRRGLGCARAGARGGRRDEAPRSCEGHVFGNGVRASRVFSLSFVFLFCLVCADRRGCCGTVGMPLGAGTAPRRPSTRAAASRAEASASVRDARGSGARE